MRGLAYIILFTFIFGLFSCGSPNKKQSNKAKKKPVNHLKALNYGIRHDVDLSEYKKIAANTAPYNTEEYPDFSPVLLLGFKFNRSQIINSIGTGVLISENWVLSVGHNFYNSDIIKIPIRAGNINAFINNDYENPESMVDFDSLVFFPTWTKFPNDFINANDLSLIRLKKPITHIKPAELISGNNAEVGSPVWHCGFGEHSREVYKPIPDNVPFPFPEKQAFQNIIDRKKEGIKSSTFGRKVYKGGLLACDFDDPEGKINSLGDEDVDKDEKLLGTGTSQKGATKFEGNCIVGDSGGGLFVQEDGKWKLTGILSSGVSANPRKLGSYGDMSVFINIASPDLQKWIQSVINKKD